MRILHTNNYKMFELIKENRPINWPKIERMRIKVREKNLTSAYTIIVNSREAGKERYKTDGTKLPIVDGQHRFVSCKLENKTVYYQINDDVTLEDIPTAASMQNSWKLTDYLHHFCTKEVSEYVKFNEYMTLNEFPPSTTLVILCGDRGSHITNMFKSGKMEVTTAWEFANKFAEAVDDFGAFINFNKHARFIEALHICFEHPKYNHERMMTKIEYLSNKLKRRPDVKSHLEQLEYVYNYKAIKRLKLNTIRDSEL